MTDYREPWDTDTDLAGGAKSDRTDTVTRILDANGAELVYGIESHDPRVSDEEYADRIRDCVNAMEGIENPKAFVEAAFRLRRILEMMTSEEFALGADFSARDAFDKAAENHPKAIP